VLTVPITTDHFQVASYGTGFIHAVTSMEWASFRGDSAIQSCLLSMLHPEFAFDRYSQMFEGRRRCPTLPFLQHRPDTPENPTPINAPTS
jgi:hypothetical protein